MPQNPPQEPTPFILRGIGGQTATLVEGARRRIFSAHRGLLCERVRVPFGRNYRFVAIHAGLAPIGERVSCHHDNDVALILQATAQPHFGVLLAIMEE